MKILSIDTASNICGVCICDNENIIYQLDEKTNRTHSENLMPMIKDAFSKSNLQLKDIDLLVCDIGPGSFTGIRIGVASVKAFADSLNIPCVGISSLEALAYNVRDCSDLICSLIDCKNDNCYFALYKFENGKCKCIIEPSSDSVTNCLNILHQFDESNILFVGDGAFVYSDVIKNSFENCEIIDDSKNDLNSYSLCLTGFNKFELEGANENILPLYLKKPQAERQLEEKLKELNNNGN